ncbi:MAG: hypothetical protein VZQ83_00300 [Eubacterium sp.]|nr:hypothetical protein [Eubacterium sp.]
MDLKTAEEALGKELAEVYRKEYQKLTDRDADLLYMPATDKAKWWCSCGVMNLISQMHCRVCGASIADLSRIMWKDYLQGLYDREHPEAAQARAEAEAAEAAAKAEEEARLKAEEEERQRAEEEARRKAEEEEARRKAEEEERQRAEEEARRKAEEEEARRKAEEEAEEERRRIEQEARAKAEAEAAEARREAEERAKARAEAEVNEENKARMEAEAKAEEETQIKAEDVIDQEPEETLSGGKDTYEDGQVGASAPEEAVEARPEDEESEESEDVKLTASRPDEPEPEMVYSDRKDQVDTNTLETTSETHNEYKDTRLVGTWDASTYFDTAKAAPPVPDSVIGFAADEEETVAESADVTFPDDEPDELTPDETSNIEFPGGDDDLADSTIRINTSDDEDEENRLSITKEEEDEPVVAVAEDDAEEEEVAAVDDEAEAEAEDVEAEVEEEEPQPEEPDEAEDAVEDEEVDVETAEEDEETEMEEPVAEETEDEPEAEAEPEAEDEPDLSDLSFGEQPAASKEDDLFAMDIDDMDTSISGMEEYEADAADDMPTIQLEEAQEMPGFGAVQTLDAIPEEEMVEFLELPSDSKEEEEPQKKSLFGGLFGKKKNKKKPEKVPEIFGDLKLKEEEPQPTAVDETPATDDAAADETIDIDAESTETADEMIDIDAESTETADEMIDIDAESTETADEMIDIDAESTETADESIDIDAESTEDVDETINVDAADTVADDSEDEPDADETIDIDDEDIAEELADFDDEPEEEQQLVEFPDGPQEELPELSSEHGALTHFKTGITEDLPLEIPEAKEDKEATLSTSEPEEDEEATLSTPEPEEDEEATISLSEPEEEENTISSLFDDDEEENTNLISGNEDESETEPLIPITEPEEDAAEEDEESEEEPETEDTPTVELEAAEPVIPVTEPAPAEESPRVVHDEDGNPTIVFPDEPVADSRFGDLDELDFPDATIPEAPMPDPINREALPRIEFPDGPQLEHVMNPEPENKEKARPFRNPGAAEETPSGLEPEDTASAEPEEPATEAEPTAETEQPQAAEAPQPTEPEAQPAQVVLDAQQPFTPDVPPAQPQPAQPQGSGTKRTLLIVAAAVGVLAIALLGFFSLRGIFGSAEGSNAVEAAMDSIGKLEESGLPTQEDFNKALNDYNAVPYDRKAEVTNAEVLEKYKDVDLKTVRDIATRMDELNDKTPFADVIALESEYEKLTMQEKQFVHGEKLDERKQLTDTESTALKAVSNIRSLLTSSDNFKPTSIKVKDDTSMSMAYRMEIKYSYVDEQGTVKEDTTYLSMMSISDDVAYNAAVNAGKPEAYTKNSKDMAAYNKCESEEVTIDCDKMMYYLDD